MNLKEKTRLLFVISALEAGGAEKSLINLLNLIDYDMLMSYFNRSLGNISRSFGFRLLNKIFAGKLKEKFYTEKDVLSLINTMECEPHRELFIRGLNNCAKTKKEEE